MLSQVRFVLVDTSHPGNIGAAARAMKTMCSRRLVLVNPKCYPSAEATARASGADDVLAEARVCKTIGEALAGCGLVIGASARLRSLPWPLIDPRQCAKAITREAPSTEVALVFGREHSGLTNEEMARCHYLVHIPSNPQHSSLNLASAVQIIAYELYTEVLSRTGETVQQQPADWVSTATDNEPLATAEDMERFYMHLFQVLSQVEFLDKDHSDKMKRRLRRLFNRSRPNRVEMNILRGMLSLFQKKLKH